MARIDMDWDLNKVLLDLVLKDMQSTLAAYFQETICYQKATKAIVENFLFTHTENTWQMNGYNKLKSN